MAIAKRLLAICAVVASCAGGVQVQDLIVFFNSADGLALDYTAASKLANSQTSFLTECGVTVPALKALKDAMYLPAMLNLDMVTVRARLLELAYQHTDPGELNLMYHTLLQGLRMTGAAGGAISLATQHAQAAQLLPLYQILRNIVPTTQQAQLIAIDCAAAGTDPATLDSVYKASRRAGMSSVAALEQARSAAVVADLSGLPGRYAKDGQLYTAKEFQQYYRADWAKEWQAAPQEKRTAKDGHAYRASEFSQHYGSGWASQWASSPIAELRRVAADGNTYTLQQFKDHYQDDWQAQWAKAFEVMDVCAGLTQQECGKQPTCQWSWNGDWTTSCVVRPRAASTQGQQAEAEVVV